MQLTKIARSGVANTVTIAEGISGVAARAVGVIGVLSPIKLNRHDNCRHS